MSDGIIKSPMEKADAGFMSTCYHPAHEDWDTGAGAMALSNERRMGINDCAGSISGSSRNGRKRRLWAWMTVKVAIVAALWLTLSGVSWAQDPLNDVHVNPPAPAPTAPIAPTDPNAKPTDPNAKPTAPNAKTKATPAPLEGTK